jgi:hypothetical protein
MPAGRFTTGPASAAYDQWRADVEAVADACAADNGRFDRGRFLRAAGVELA